MPSPLRPRRPRTRRGIGPEVEPLEGRALRAGVDATPTDDEQYMLELINRARSDPPAEGRRLVALAQSDPLIRQATVGWDLAAFSRVISGYGSLPPLAFNTRLIAAARDQDASMVDQNSQRHSPAGFLTDPTVATAADGRAYFDVTGASWATGENIFAFSRNVNSSVTTAYVDYFHAGFLIDWGNPDYGHLTNVLAPGPAEATSATHYPYSEIGIGLLYGAIPSNPPDPNPPNPANAGISVGPALVSQEFGWRSTANADLTGTVYLDADRNAFYTPGEGLGGVTIRAVGRGGVGSYTTQTWSSGGYTLPLPPGVYDVTASGGDLGAARTTVVQVGADNAGWSLRLDPAAAVAALPVPADYDGDGRADLATYASDTATWSIRDSSLAATRTVTYGWTGLDLPVPGRYDGGRAVEVAVFRPTTATWFVRQPDGSTRSTQFGWAGRDIPVPGDYDGDGKADLAVFRPDTAEWFVRRSSDGVTVRSQFGWAGLDEPVPADFDGDGKVDLAVFRPNTATWYVRGSASGPNAVVATPYGWIGRDQPIARDYDGDGKADIAVFRPDTAEWFVRRADGSTKSTPFGWTGLDQANPADYDGDGKADLAVFRPPTATWYVRGSRDGSTTATPLGRAGRATTGLASLAANLAVPSPWYSWSTPIPAAATESGTPARSPRRDGHPSGPGARLAPGWWARRSRPGAQRSPIAPD